MIQPKAQILIVEDDPAIRRGLSDVLIFQGYKVQGEEDGEQGLRAILDGQFDLILLDVMLPGLDGFSICRRVRQAKPNQPIIIITAKGAEDDIVAGFTAGADDYIAKPFSLRELTVRVESILRRSGKSVYNQQLKLAGILFDSTNLRAHRGAAVIDLTRREMDIMTYLARFRHRIVSKKELLIEVWHYADADIETRTVDIHMLKLRKKLACLDKEADLIRTVRGEGYRLVHETT